MAKNDKKDAHKPAKKERAKKLQIGKFFREVFGELKKMTWPTRKELVSYTFTVLAFIAIFAVIIGLLDLAFGKGLGLIASL